MLFRERTFAARETGPGGGNTASIRSFCIAGIAPDGRRQRLPGPPHPVVRHANAARDPGDDDFAATILVWAVLAPLHSYSSRCSDLPFPVYQRIGNERVGLVFAGERGPDLQGVSGGRARWGSPPGNVPDPLTSENVVPSKLDADVSWPIRWQCDHGDEGVREPVCSTDGLVCMRFQCPACMPFAVGSVTHS